MNKNLTNVQSEPDPESDKENVLPHKTGKRKAKPIQSEVQSKISKITEAEKEPQEPPQPIASDPINQEERETSTSDQTNSASIVPKETEENAVVMDSFTKKSSDRSYSNNKSKKGNQQTSESSEKTELVDYVISQEQVIDAQDDQIVLNLSQDMQQILNANQSIILPLNMETFSNNQSTTTEGPQIVHEIYWFTDGDPLPEPQKPKSTNMQDITASPPPGDEAEKAPNSSSSSQDLILLELQVPAKDIAMPKTSEAIRRVRSSSSVSTERRSSEGKYAKMSELMTEEQKMTIESFYKIDMSVINDRKVSDEVLVLDKSKFKCKICSTTYTRLDKCQVHVWRHLDMKPYFCKACEYTTLTVSNIRCHIRKSHLKIKPFECHICKKSYTSSTQLEEHLNTHTGVRPFECNNCNFASTSKQVLAHHVLTHKNEKVPVVF